MEIVGKLLDAGADPNAKSADGTTPLMRAARAGREETAKRLLAGGATAGPT
jgi:ankyrin repeat protein